jgi:hypothetical protein
MSPQNPKPAPDQETFRGDPWHAFGYLVSGVFLYGALGWLADWWLGTSFLVAVGIVLGAGLGIYLTWNRFIRPRARGPESL